MRSRREAILPGLILLLVGLYFLAQNLNVDIPGFDQLWPIFVVGAGIVFLSRYFLDGRRDPGRVFVGTAAMLTGLFFFYILFGPGWGAMDELWPVWPLIGGLAFFALWLAKPGDWGVLVPAALALLVGVVGLGYTLGALEPAVVRQLANFWPALLIVLGLAILLRNLFRRRSE